MRYFEVGPIVQEDEHEHEHGAEYTLTELAHELKDWMSSEHMKEASLHVLWSDFPLRRHITTSNKWARVLVKGEQLNLWQLVKGRQEGSKKVVIS